MENFEKIEGSIVLSKSAVESVLAQETKEGKRELEPLKAFAKAEGMPINILEDTNVESEIEVHTNVADIWYCLEGEVTFVLGGELVESFQKVNKDGSLSETEIRAKDVIGAKEKVLTKGDWLWIPAGVPHKHKTTGTARLVIIKVPN